MTLRATVTPLPGRLPSLVWRWDAETDILSGSFRVPDGDSAAGMVEFTDAVGSVVVVELQDGVLAGVDLVVWPEVSAVARLALPLGVVEGRVELVSDEEAGVSVFEVEAELRVVTDAAETVLHVCVGDTSPGTAIRVADHLIVEVSDQQTITGFWLTGVPAFPAYDEA